MTYLVQEFVAHKWFTVRSFTTRAEAEEWLGANRRNYRIKEVK